jgi:hypothetical protein
MLVLFDFPLLVAHETGLNEASWKILVACESCSQFCLKHGFSWTCLMWRRQNQLSTTCGSNEMLAVVRGKAVLASVALLLISASQSYADPRTYCEAFARDIVDRKLLAAGRDPNPGLSGEHTATIEPAAAVKTASLVTGGTDAKWRWTYNRSFDDCMDQYTDEVAPKRVAITPPAPPKPPERAKRPVTVATKPAPEKPVLGTPEPGTQAWNDYCLGKHPSYDAKTGLYRTYSGNQRKCR